MANKASRPRARGSQPAAPVQAGPRSAQAGPSQPVYPSEMSFFDRLQARWDRYMALRGRADENSMSWWRLKVLEAAWVVAFALCFTLFMAVLGQLIGWGFIVYIGIFFLGLAVLWFLRALAAPLTCKWVVFADENWYYAVIDRKRRTIDYIMGGQETIVPWMWNAKVIPYADFNFIPVNNVRIENVMNVRRLPVDVVVSAPMRFDPTQADRSVLPMLRRMNKVEMYQGMLTNFINDVVVEHLVSAGEQSHLHLAQVGDVPALKTVLLDRLKGLEKMGLFTTTVVVNVAMQNRNAQLLNRLDRLQTMDDVRELAEAEGISLKEAMLLYSLSQRPSNYRRRGGGRVGYTNFDPFERQDSRPKSTPPQSPPTQPSAAAPNPSTVDTAKHWIDRDSLYEEEVVERPQPAPPSPGRTQPSAPDQPPVPDPMREVRRVMQYQGYVPDPWANRNKAKRSRPVYPPKY